MTCLRFFYIVAICTICTGKVLSQSAFFDMLDEHSSRYHQSLYHYDFPEAKAQLNFIADDTSLSGYLFQVNYLWWMIITGEQDQNNFDLCFELLENAEKLINEEAYVANDDQLAALLVYLFQARIHVFQNNYYKALVDYSQMLSMLKKLINMEENENYSEEEKLILGFYHYTIGKLKKKYPVFYPYFLLLPKADFQKGKAWVLASLKSNSVLVRTEALYFLMKISLELDHDYESTQLFAHELIGLYPGNALFLFYQYRAFKELEQDENAQKVFEKISKISNEIPYLSDQQKVHFTNIIKELYAN